MYRRPSKPSRSAGALLERPDCISRLSSANLVFTVWIMSSNFLGQKLWLSLSAGNCGLGEMKQLAQARAGRSRAKAWEWASLLPELLCSSRHHPPPPGLRLTSFLSLPSLGFPSPGFRPLFSALALPSSTLCRLLLPGPSVQLCLDEFEISC